MTAKAARLAALTKISRHAVPPTFSSLAEVEASGSDGPWYVRATSSFAGTRGPLSTSDVRKLLAGSGGQLEIQPLIEALSSGALCSDGSATIIEATGGVADGLFRSGEDGSLLLVDPLGRRWVNAAVPCPGVAWSEIDEPLRRLAEPHTPGNGIVVLEWILDVSRRMWLVDRKLFSGVLMSWELGDEFASFLLRCMAEGGIRSTGDRDEQAVVGSTILDPDAHYERGSSVVFESGAVLSHAVVRVLEASASAAVRVRAGWWCD